MAKVCTFEVILLFHSFHPRYEYLERAGTWVFLLNHMDFSDPCGAGMHQITMTVL